MVLGPKYEHFRFGFYTLFHEMVKRNRQDSAHNNNNKYHCVTIIQVEEVNTRCQQITDKWNEFGELTGKRGEKLKSEIERAERLDNLWLEFAKRASPFNNWMDGAKEDLLDTFKVNTLDEIQDLKHAQEKFKANMPAAKVGPVFD